MKSKFTLIALGALALAGCNDQASTGAAGGGSRQEIRIVGSSTVFPFAKAVAEAFSKADPSRKAPVLESNGTGAGIEQFCAGVGAQTPDIANARIEFENGCVANLTASRISLKQMRKMRLFQPDHYISLDFLEKNAQIVRLYDQNAADLPPQDQLMEFETNDGKKWLQMLMPEVAPVNAIQRELEMFHESISSGVEPEVTLGDGFRALEVAHRILKEIETRRAALS